MSKMFDKQTREDESVIEQFFDLLPLIYSILFDNPGENSILGTLNLPGGLDDRTQRLMWIEKLLEQKRKGKMFEKSTLLLLDPNKRSPHVQRIIKRKK